MSVRTTVDIADDLHAALRQRAGAERTPVRSLITEAIESKLRLRPGRRCWKMIEFGSCTTLGDWMRHFERRQVRFRNNHLPKRLASVCVKVSQPVTLLKSARSLS